MITDTEYDGLGNFKEIIDPNGDPTDYVYDDLNRLMTEIDPLLHSTQYRYDGLGNKTGMIDAENVKTRYEFDALSRLTAVIENYQSGVNPDHETNVRTEYTYDGAGNPKKIHDGNEHDTTFGHDDLNRTIWEKDALLHTTSHVFDGVGNRKALTGANNQTTAFGYDDLNRLTSFNYPDPDPDVSFTYDGLGNRKIMIDGAGTTEWFYDSMSRVTSVVERFL